MELHEYGYTFRAPQQVFEIAGTRFGGQPGENPVVAIGTIFYLGDRALLDSEGRSIDRDRARKAIEEAQSLAREVGIGFALDVVIPSRAGVETIIPFVAEFDVPLLLDATDRGARIESYRMAKELGIEKKVIANGIYIDTDEEELEALRDSGIESAILLAFDPSKPYESIRPTERVRLVKEVLLPKAKRAGIEKVVVDAIVLDPASIALSASAISMIKNELGYPATCAPANALGNVSTKNMSVEEVIGIHASIAAMLRAMGADAVFYGPVKRIRYVAYALAMVDAMLGYLAKHRGSSIPRDHPLRKYLKKIQQLFTR